MRMAETAKSAKIFIYNVTSRRSELTRGDDAEHTETPSPEVRLGIGRYESSENVTTDPSIDDPRRRRNERCKQSTLE
jgi:hypothetical protein